jgi:hypothetical protein
MASMRFASESQRGSMAGEIHGVGGDTKPSTLRERTGKSMHLVKKR